jgi:filamentous hemagglutinin
MVQQVAETRFPGTQVLIRKTIATLVSSVLVLQPVLLHAQSITPEAGGSPSYRPTIGAAPNGVPLIDIVRPNSQGLSHNKYGNFNVGTPGVILNNFDGEVGTSKLGGATPGNPNLTGKGSATVILNEVTSQNRTALNGPTEVFGGRADVVIANPNGITCDGCGFINTPRATLTTGAPDIGADGSLNGFRVSNGDVTFGRNGANFASGDGSVDLFDVVSRTIQIDGTIYGHDLRLTAGQSKFDYATGEATALDPNAGGPEFAIDGSALGAMQAGRIKMVVTDKGAGVRMRGDMAANAGELTLSADGKISIGKASGKGVSVSSGQKISAARVASGKAASLKGKNGVAVETIDAFEGIVVDGGIGLVDATGMLSSGAGIDIRADGTLQLQKTAASGPTTFLSRAGSISVSDTVTSGAALSLSASSGSVSGTNLLSKGDIALLSGLDLGFSGLVRSEGNVQATAGTSIRYGGMEANGNIALSSLAGVISLDKRTAAGGDLSIQQKNIDLSENRADLAATGTLFLGADTINLANSTMTFGGFDLASTYATDLIGTQLNAVVSGSSGTGNVSVSANSVVMNSATKLLAANDLTLTVPEIQNSGQLAAGGSIRINASGNLTNRATGLIYAGNDAALYIGGVLANEEGAIISRGDLTIAGDSNGTRTTKVINRSGLISAENDFAILTSNLINERATAPTYSTVRISSAVDSAYNTYSVGAYGGSGPFIQHNQTKYGIGFASPHVYREVSEDRLTSAGSAESLIKAGGNLAIDTIDLSNSYSSIEAGTGLKLTGLGTMTNAGVQLQRTSTVTCNDGGGCGHYAPIYYRWEDSYPRGGDSSDVVIIGHSFATNPFGTRDPSKDVGPGRTIQSVEAIGGLPATIRSGGELDIEGFAAVNNSAIAGSIADHIAVDAFTPSTDPTAVLNNLTAAGALFTLGTIPTPQAGGFGGTIPEQSFLYETRAAFVDVSKFYGSSYFLNRIGYQPDRKVTFLGDAYFENQYIEQQHRLATGSGFTGKDSVSEIKQLLDNGASYLSNRPRTFGEPLTAEEIAQLTQPIVIYVRQSVNGAEVLAPVLYLASNANRRSTAAGAVIAGNQVSVDAGLFATSGMVASNQNLAVAASSVSSVSGTFASGGNMSIRGTDSVLLANAKVDASGNLALTSNGDINISAAERTTTTVFGGKRSSTTVVRTTSLGSEVSAGGSVTAQAGGNLNVLGSDINAGGTVGLKAAGDITIAEAQNLTTIDSVSRKKGGLFGGKKESKSHSETSTTVSSSIMGDKGISIESGSDTSISASNLVAGTNEEKADIGVKAGGDIIVASGKDTSFYNESSSSKGLFSKKSSSQQGYDEDTAASQLIASGNINLKAAGNAVISGSDVSAGEKVSIQGDSVALLGAQEQHASASSSKKSGLFAGSGGGFFSLWGKNEKEQSQASELNSGTWVSGGTDVTLKAKNTDVNVIGSSIMTGRDLTLEAARDVNVTPGAESSASFEKERRSGFGIQVKSGSGSATVGIGYGKSLDQTQQSSETNAQSVLFAGQDLTISSGRDANMQAAHASGDRDVSITAKRDINLLSAQDKSNYEHLHEELFAGISVSVSTSIVNAATSVRGAAQKLTTINDGYSAANAAFASLKAYDALNNIAKGGNLASASLTVGFSYEKQKEALSTSVPVPTEIRAGQSIMIAASENVTGHAAQIAAGYDNDGNIALSSDEKAGDITLKAGKNIVLESAQANNSSFSSTTSAGASFGLSAGVGLQGVTTGLTGGANMSAGRSNANGTSQLNSHINGTGEVTLTSGQETKLAGAVISGDTVTAKVGGDLTIASVPDTGESSNRSASAGFSLGGGQLLSGIQIGGGSGSGKTNWIGEQSGLVSGGKMDVTVGGNTDLVAGKIISESGDLTVDTGTLTHDNFQGSRKYEGFSIDVGIDLANGRDASGNSTANHTLEGSYQLDDTRQTVRATVGPGEILVRDKQQQAALEMDGTSTLPLNELNRNPDKAYEITKDKHVGLEVYLSTNSLNAIGSGLKKMVAPGGFIDKYLLGRQLTAEEQAQVKAGVEALANGGSFVGCGQKQGFNLFNWIVTTAYAYETTCTIRQADGTFIELGIKTYEECKDAIYAYLNGLTMAERAQTLRSAGFAAASSVSSNAESAVMSWWLLGAIEKLDGQPYGGNLKAYLAGTGEGTRFAEEFGPQRWAIWNDSSLSWDEKSVQLEKTGLDVSTIIAMAILGGVTKSGAKGPIYQSNKEAKIAAETLGFKKINETIHGGQAVYKKGDLYITRDLDGHNGGAWKMATSVKGLGSKGTRLGTYDSNLNRIGD